MRERKKRERERERARAAAAAGGGPAHAPKDMFICIQCNKRNRWRDSDLNIVLQLQAILGTCAQRSAKSLWDTNQGGSQRKAFWTAICRLSLTGARSRSFSSHQAHHFSRTAPVTLWTRSSRFVKVLACKPHTIRHNLSAYGCVSQVWALCIATDDCISLWFDCLFGRWIRCMYVYWCWSGCTFREVVVA